MAGRAAKTLRPADEISHYHVVGPLGAGGMGEVYLAQDQTLERKVALKILPPDLMRSEERVRRFMLEAKSASSLNHPSIITIYEIGRDTVRSASEAGSDPVHFISMELVSGKTLAVLIHDEQTDLRTLLGYLAQAADGLAKAHAAGIVHRDIKPGNIMVSTDGFAKVLDFGLAKLTERVEPGVELSAAPTRTADATGEGLVVGTVGYMSPEQVQGKTVDARSDIFSFGCILYEAATRRRPFVAESNVETLHKILNEQPPPIEDLNPGVPAELRRLIRRCLAKSPDQRFQSMRDLALELRDIVDEYDALSTSSSSGGMAAGVAAATRPTRRPAALAMVVGGVVIVAGAALGWWLLMRGGVAWRAQPFQTVSMTTLTNRGDLADCVLSADGRYLAYVAGRGGLSSLRVLQVATGSDVEVLPVTSAGIYWPAFSPDGNYLYYVTPKPEAQTYRSLYRVPSLGGRPEERAFDVDSRVSFSPDGRRIAFWRGVPETSENRLVVRDLDAGTDRVLGAVTDREGPAGGPTWSPDGRQIAAALFMPAGTLRSIVALFDPTTGRRRDHVTLAGTQITSLAWLRSGSGLVASAWHAFDFTNRKTLLIGYPGTAVQRVTNDFSDYYNVSTSGGDEAIATVRRTRLENVWLADANGGEPAQITAVVNPEASPSGLAAPDTGTLVFSARRDQGIQLCTLSPSGGEPRPLTTGPGLSEGANGAVGVVCFNRWEPSGGHVWTVRSAGSGLRQITSGSGEWMSALSHDGRFCAFIRGDSLGAVWLVSLGSGEVSRIAALQALGFSPDGERLFLVRDIGFPDASGQSRNLLVAVSTRGRPGVDSLWFPGRSTYQKLGPDGRSLLYLDPVDPVRNIHRVEVDGGPPAPLTRFGEGRVLNYWPSPDGKRLAIARRVGTAENVWVAGADGSHPVQVTRFSTERLFELCWLPDSRRMAIGAGSQASDAVLIRKFR